MHTKVICGGEVGVLTRVMQRLMQTHEYCELDGSSNVAQRRREADPRCCWMSSGCAFGSKIFLRQMNRKTSGWEYTIRDVTCTKAPGTVQDDLWHDFLFISDRAFC